MKRLFLLLVLFLAAGCGSSRPVLEGQTAHRFETQIPIGYDYLLFLPRGYDDEEAWPLMLFLHGAGERGDDLERLKVHGPPKLADADPDFPFIVVSPQVPEGEWWDTRTLSALLDDVESTYHVDPDRVYVTGLSMGGFGTWALGLAEPERFAAIVPICGGGQSWLAGRLAGTPVWAFHGAKDEVVPLQASEEMVQAIQRAGGNVRLTVYPDRGHDAWTPTYDNPELYDWLLAQRRGRAANP